MKTKYISIFLIGVLYGNFWLADLFLKQNIISFQEQLTKALAFSLILNTNSLEFAQAIVNEPEIASGEYYDHENGKKILAEQLAINPGTLKDLALPEVLIIHPNLLKYEDWKNLIEKLKKLSGVSAIIEPNYDVLTLFQIQNNLLTQQKILHSLNILVTIGLIFIGKSLKDSKNSSLISILFFSGGIALVINRYCLMVLNRLLISIICFIIGILLNKKTIYKD